MYIIKLKNGQWRLAKTISVSAYITPIWIRYVNIFDIVINISIYHISTITPIESITL